MFNWLFRNKEELPEIESLWEEKPVIDVIPREYSDKGITISNSGKYVAQLCIRIGKKGNKIANTIYIGTYDTKLEAQEARWNYIESLK